MKKVFPILLFAAISQLIATTPQFPEIVDEDVELMIGFRSLPDLRKQWSEHPMSEVFKDEALMKKFINPIGEESDDESFDFFKDLEDEFGLTEDEFFELFNGQLGLAFYNFSNLVQQKDKRAEFVFMAEFSGSDEKLDELMQKEINPLVEHELVKEKFMGETLFFDETFDGESTYVEDGYALVDGIFVLATPEDQLRKAVEIIKEGTETPLADSATYQRSREYSGRGDISIYLNLGKLMPSLNLALGELPISGPMALTGITSESLKNALSLEVLQGAFLDFDFVEDGILSHYGMLYSEKDGILKLLAYSEDDLPEANYVPKDVLSSSITNFDFSAMYRGLEEILGTASPGIISMIDIQIQKIQSEAGVDLRSDLIENFGKQAVSFSTFKEDEAANALESVQTEQVMVIDIKDSETFSQALNALIDSAQIVRPLIKESNFEGETVYSITVPNQQAGFEMAFNYVVTRSKFIFVIGHISLLQTVLSNMNDEGDGFWQDPELIALFERIEQPDPVSRTYYDVEQLIEPFFMIMSNMAYFADPSGSIQAEEMPEGLKGAYRLVSEGNEAPDGLFGRVLVVKAKDEE